MPSYGSLPYIWGISGRRTPLYWWLWQFLILARATDALAAGAFGKACDHPQ